MQKGEYIEVLFYRGDKPTIEIGKIESIRNTHTENIKLSTYKNYIITRSKYLITLSSKDGKHRSYYDKFLIYTPVSKLRKLWLKLRGKI